MLSVLFFSAFLLSQDLKPEENIGIENLASVRFADERMKKFFRSSISTSLMDRTLAYDIEELSRDRSEDTYAVTNYSGVMVFDAERKVHFASTETRDEDAEVGLRTEMFRFNGKERAKAYGAVDEYSSYNRVHEFKPDSITGEREDGAALGIYDSGNVELDPFGLSVTEPMAIRHRYSRVDRVAKYFMTSWKSTTESESWPNLVSEWKNAEKKRSGRIVFDSKQGGMPVLYSSFSTDSSGRRTKDYSASVSTKWIEINERWVPLEISSKVSNLTHDREFKVRFSYLTNKAHRNLLSEIKWKDLHEDAGAHWHQLITLRVLESISAPDGLPE